MEDKKVKCESCAGYDRIRSWCVLRGQVVNTPRSDRNCRMFTDRKKASS